MDPKSSIKPNVKFPLYLKVACTGVSIIAFGYLAFQGQTIIVPLIIGGLLALVLHPISCFLEQKLKFPRTIAAMISTILFFGAVIALIGTLGAQLTILKDDWPAFQEQLTTMVAKVQGWLSARFGLNEADQVNLLNDTAKSSVNAGTAILGVALMSLSSLMILLVFTFLYTFFILIYRRHLVNFLLVLNTERNYQTVIEIVHEVQYVVKRYLVGLAIQACLVSAMVYGSLFAIGVKYSLLLGVIAGVINILPYVGISVALIIISLIAFATGALFQVALVVVAIVVIHIIDGNYIIPKIVGSKVKINSMFAMMAIIVGEMLWGFSGMFLAIPVLAVLKIIFDRVKELTPWGLLIGEEPSTDTELVCYKNQTIEKSSTDDT